MTSLGQKLRRRRLEKGLEIALLAARTKISAKFLEAIESDRRELLPAGFFFRNWTVQYARALALDETEIQADIDRILSVEEPLPLPGQVRPESKESPGWRPKMPRTDGAPRLFVSFSFLLVVVVVCSGFYTWWHKEKLARETNAMTAPAAVEAEGAVKKQAKPAQVIGQLQKQPATPPVETATANLASAQTNDALLLELHAREQTWLTISPDGKQIFNGVLQANESKTVEARESARIKVGNAGGLDVRFNGKPVGELGPRGKVRVLLVGPDGVHIYPTRGAGEPGNSPIAAMGRSETGFNSRSETAFSSRSETAFNRGAPFRLTLQQ